MRPLGLAAERLLPVHEAFHGLLPHEGVQRGTNVAVGGIAATSLTLGLVASASSRGSWLAAVGVPGLGLAAAEGLGVSLERLVVVDPVPAEQWVATVAALLDAFDVVVVGSPVGVRVRPGEVRRIGGRLRERGAVLVRTGWSAAGWPEHADLELTVRPTGGNGGWEGIGEGHGYLRARRVTVEVRGRRGADRPRRGELWLPDAEGRLAAVATPTIAGAVVPGPATRLALVPRAG